MMASLQVFCDAYIVFGVFAGRLSCHGTFRRKGIAFCCGLEKELDVGYLVFFFFVSTLFEFVLLHNVSVCLVDVVSTGTSHLWSWLIIN